MYYKTTKYPVMEGEPHLGSITECELIAEPMEIERAFYDEWAYKGMVIPLITVDDIQLDAFDYFNHRRLQTLEDILEDANTTGADYTPQDIEKVMNDLSD